MSSFKLSVSERVRFAVAILRKVDLVSIVLWGPTTGLLLATLGFMGVLSDKNISGSFDEEDVVTILIFFVLVGIYIYGKEQIEQISRDPIFLKTFEDSRNRRLFAKESAAIIQAAPLTIALAAACASRVV